MLEKKTIISQIEVLESDCVQVRTLIVVMEDGIKLSETYHRHCILPGANYTQEDAKVQAVCAAVHTPEVVAAYKAMQKL